MSALKHTRPFNLEHARAGAPFCCADGCKAEIFKYTPAVAFGTITNQDGWEFSANWSVDGAKKSGVLGESKALVMTPLGMIDGKPVFVGDEVITPTGMKWTVTPTCRYVPGRSLADCTWPATAAVYPETRMDHRDVAPFFGKDEHWHAVTVVKVANAALRHAIDAGQVVVPGEAVAGIRAFNPHTGCMAHLVYHKDEPMRAHIETIPRDAYVQSQRDLRKAENLLEALGYRSAGNGEWSLDAARNTSARDMAIAEAVRRDCLRYAANSHQCNAPSKIIGLDLAAIIAGVKS